MHRPRIVGPLIISVSLALGLSLFATACSKTAAQEASASGNSGRGGPAGRGGRGGRGGAQPVVVAKAAQRDVPVVLDAVGNVEASTLIAVRSQVSGTLERVDFREGEFVRKGALLFTLDRRPLEAALQQAEANLVRDQALVNQAQAQLARDASTADYQKVSADRQAALVERGIVAKDTGDQARAQADAVALSVTADRAAVESARAQLAVQQAAVDAARLQLAYTTIRSPIDGRTGDLTVKAGNLVTANSTQLMTIAQIEPVFVTFAIPSTHLPTIEHAARGESLVVTATPQDEEGQPVEGRLTFWDNVVDPTTDTIKLKATFTNTERRLWPGQFSRVQLRLRTLKDAVVVPQQALQTGQDGQFVFVVSNGTAQQRAVKVGQRVDDDIVVLEGLSPGETVVTEGQLRLEQGTRVQIGDANGVPQGGRGGRGGGGARGGRSAAGGGNPAGAGAGTTP